VTTKRSISSEVCRPRKRLAVKSSGMWDLPFLMDSLSVSQISGSPPIARSGSLQDERRRHCWRVSMQQRETTMRKSIYRRRRVTDRSFDNPDGLSPPGITTHKQTCAGQPAVRKRQQLRGVVGRAEITGWPLGTRRPLSFSSDTKTPAPAGHFVVVAGGPVWNPREIRKGSGARSRVRFRCQIQR